MGKELKRTIKSYSVQLLVMFIVFETFCHSYFKYTFYDTARGTVLFNITCILVYRRLLCYKMSRKHFYSCKKFSIWPHISVAIFFPLSIFLLPCLRVIIYMVGLPNIATVAFVTLYHWNVLLTLS